MKNLNEQLDINNRLINSLLEENQQILDEAGVGEITATGVITSAILAPSIGPYLIYKTIRKLTLDIETLKTENAKLRLKLEKAKTLGKSREVQKIKHDIRSNVETMESLRDKKEKSMLKYKAKLDMNKNDSPASKDEIARRKEEIEYINKQIQKQRKEAQKY